jgi:hypothetical protein
VRKKAAPVILLRVSTRPVRCAKALLIGSAPH